MAFTKDSHGNFKPLSTPRSRLINDTSDSDSDIFSVVFPKRGEFFHTKHIPAKAESRSYRTAWSKKTNLSPTNAEHPFSKSTLSNSCLSGPVLHEVDGREEAGANLEPGSNAHRGYKLERHAVPSCVDICFEDSALAGSKHIRGETEEISEHSHISSDNDGHMYNDSNDSDWAPEEFCSEKGPSKMKEVISHSTEVDSARANAILTSSSEAASRQKKRTADDKFISKILEKQKAILDERCVAFSPHAAKRAKRNIKTLRVLESASADPLTIEEMWHLYIEELHPSFLSNTDELEEETSRVRKGVIAYKGVNVNEKNSHDMKRIYSLEWYQKEALCQPVRTYEQFRVVVGQYARFAISVKVVSAKSLCDKGALFAIICELDAIQAFIGYFQVRAAAATVLCKALHLLKLASHADSYFRTSGLSFERGQLKCVAEFLRSISRAYKTESRRQASERKTNDDRAMCGTLITPSDFRKFSRASKQICSDILGHAMERIESHGAQRFESYLENSPKYVDKWFINFLCLLMLVGGGQRPQVYTLLEAPLEIDIHELNRKARTKGYFELAISGEKRMRTMDLPHLILPKSFLPFLTLHVKYMLPHIYHKFDIPEDSAKRRYLLLNTRTGDVLESLSVTSTLKRFLKSIDPEMGNVTTMSLRSSYASMMLGKYRAKKIMTHMSEVEFMQYVAKVMNTSIEQLQNTYAAADREDFEAIVAKLASIMDSGNETDEEEEEDDF